MDMATTFGLPTGYRQRVRPEYFADDANDGVTWQPDVYPYAVDLGKRLGRSTIIDIGCGRAGKLVTIAATEPGWRFVGVDFGPNIVWCGQHHTFGEWIEADLESCTSLPIPSETLHDAVIVCSDVLEHLVRPDTALALMRRLSIDGDRAPIVLSTPARERRAGTDYIGEPHNPSHVREWTSTEFQIFLSVSGFEIEHFEYTRSDDHGGGLTTQLVAVVPAP